MRMEHKKIRIGDLAEQLEVKKFVIRFWEKEFDMDSNRSEGGQRHYSESDCKKFALIKDLLYNQGMTIAGAKKMLENKNNRNSEQNDIMPDVKKLLDLKEKLLKLKELL